MFSSPLAAALGAALLAPGLAQAEVLTNVPMQGGMAMPMVSYSATLGKINVMMPADVPQLTPLMISNPGDSFDPADPWFAALDPSQQGQSFSRRYGFVMASVTDPLPANTQIWIRKLSGSPELSAFRYRDTDPKAFEPIFGTGGVTNAMFWNKMMFHPAFAAPPGTNELTAIFELYLLNTLTGQEVADSSSGPLEFVWTNVLDGRPSLGLGRRMVVFYPADAAGWALEGTDQLPNGAWTSVTNAPVSLEGKSAVVLEANDPRQFFRMKQATP